MATEPETETGYLESCCWDDEQDQCPGAGCACRCHQRQVAEYTQAQKVVAFAAADAYFKQWETMTAVPESIRALGRRPIHSCR